MMIWFYLRLYAESGVCGNLDVKLLAHFDKLSLGSESDKSSASRCTEVDGRPTGASQFEARQAKSWQKS